MSIVVQKYGGSSVSNVGKLRTVAKRIASTVSEGHRVCVVVSAMGSTTDELLAQAALLSKAPSRRELDMLLTCGERASMALLSMAVIEEGLDAISFTGSQCGILTNDRHSGARIVEVRPFRVEDELEKGKVVIVAGYQGVSYKREITTLGRGGTDTTAVALAAALGAEYCEICSDVDGVRTADPRTVSSTELLSEISYDEALELTAHGAKVLHADAVEYAQKTGIALWARATDGSGAGTRIQAEAPASVAVTSAKVVRVSAKSGGKVFEAMNEALAFAVYVGVGKDKTEAWLELSDVPDWAKVRDAFPDEIKVEENLAAVTVVGNLVGARPQALALVRNSLNKAGVSMLGMQSSPTKVTCLVSDSAEEKAVQCLHDSFRKASSL